MGWSASNPAPQPSKPQTTDPNAPNYITPASRANIGGKGQPLFRNADGSPHPGIPDLLPLFNYVWGTNFTR